jgi:hypothetical protein
VRYEFDQDLAPAVDYQAVQRRLFLVFEQLVARLMYAALSPAEQFDRVSVCVSQQEPASDLDNGGVVGLAHGRGVQTVQRHGRAGAGVVLRFGLSQALPDCYCVGRITITMACSEFGGCWRGGGGGGSGDGEGGSRSVVGENEWL